ncbi:hypothetical protein C8R47DRAFT_1150007 [Mycena vitilis]|nr:hypothetical protein C8R47DRAFT_1150007 [Mycena vitilis]
MKLFFAPLALSSCLEGPESLSLCDFAFSALAFFAFFTGIRQMRRFSPPPKCPCLYPLPHYYAGPRVLPRSPPCCLCAQHHPLIGLQWNGGSLHEDRHLPVGKNLYLVSSGRDHSYTLLAVTRGTINAPSGTSQSTACELSPETCGEPELEPMGIPRDQMHESEEEHRRVKRLDLQQWHFPHEARPLLRRPPPQFQSGTRLQLRPLPQEDSWWKSEHGARPKRTSSCA